MRAGIYLRISLDRSGEALGVTRQREDCLKTAAQLGWDVVEEYIDNDISATSGKPRPAYRKMLADVEAGHIEAIVAWHPDRLYRKLQDLGAFLDICKQNNTQIATARGGAVDLTTPTGRLTAGMLAQIATYEGEAKADRWRRSVRQRREAGLPPTWGPRMFGYTREGELIDSEANVIRDMARHVIDGGSVTSLARKLNDAGITTTLGNEWGTSAVRKLLTNPRLAGHSTLSQGFEKKNAKGEKVKRYTVATVGVGQWKPILDEQTFEQCRALIATRTGTERKPRVALLAGLVRCGKCGQKLMTGGRGARGDKPSVRIYRCPASPGRAGCGGMSVDAVAVEEVVEAYARHRIDQPAVRTRVAELQGSASGVVADVNATEERIRELEAQLDEPGVPVTTIIRAIDRARERLEGLLSQLAASKPVSLPTSSLSWPSDLGQRRALIDVVVESVTIQPASQTSGRRAFDPARVQIAAR